MHLISCLLCSSVYTHHHLPLPLSSSFPAMATSLGENLKLLSDQQVQFFSLFLSFPFLVHLWTNASEFWFGYSSSKRWWRCCWRTAKTTCFEIGLLPASTTTARKRSSIRFSFFIQFNWIDLPLPSFILFLNDAAFSLVDSTRFELPWRFAILHQKR